MSLPFEFVIVGVWTCSWCASCRTSVSRVSTPAISLRSGYAANVTRQRNDVRNPYPVPTAREVIFKTWMRSLRPQ